MCDQCFATNTTAETRRASDAVVSSPSPVSVNDPAPPTAHLIEQILPEEQGSAESPETPSNEPTSDPAPPTAHLIEQVLPEEQGSTESPETPSNATPEAVQPASEPSLEPSEAPVAEPAEPAAALSSTPEPTVKAQQALGAAVAAPDVEQPQPEDIQAWRRAGLPEIRRDFSFADDDGSGMLSRVEFETHFKRLIPFYQGDSDDPAADIWDSIDDDGDGYISFAEYLDYRREEFNGEGDLVDRMAAKASTREAALAAALSEIERLKKLINNQPKKAPPPKDLVIKIANVLNLVLRVIFQDVYFFVDFLD